MSRNTEIIDDAQHVTAAGDISGQLPDRVAISQITRDELARKFSRNRTGYADNMPARVSKRLRCRPPARCLSTRL
ncbi:hypothetical protein AA0323_2776 [Asaia siamensis NRIC 0323]|nr:hypothetical protein AA0323_2776 [Asaia siamensis NRIC 0323]